MSPPAASFGATPAPRPPSLWTVRSSCCGRQPCRPSDSWSTTTRVRKHRPQLRSLHDDVLSGEGPVGSVLAVTTLDHLGVTMREMTRLVRELHEHGAGVRTLAGVVDLGTTPPLTAAAELALGVLGLVERAEATHTGKRVVLSRGIAAGQGQQSVGPARWTHGLWRKRLWHGAGPTRTPGHGPAAWTLMLSRWCFGWLVRTHAGAICGSWARPAS
ncbi:MAG: recombinase family protein [Mycobacteriaceae bacterium]